MVSCCSSEIGDVVEKGMKFRDIAVDFVPGRNGSVLPYEKGHSWRWSPYLVQRNEAAETLGKVLPTKQSYIP
jgi:hypothetical protein